MELYKNVASEKERRMLEKSMENDGKPPRQKLMQFLKIVDRDSYKQGKDSPVYHFFDPLKKGVYRRHCGSVRTAAGLHSRDMVGRMVQLGVLESYPDEHGVDRVFIPQLCVGALEWVMAGNVYDEHPEQSVLFKQFTYGSSGGNGIYMPMSNHGVHRAVPVEKALENESRKLDWEELSEIVEKNGNGSFCAVKCICRIPWRLAPASPVCTGVCLSVIWQITAFAKASGSN